MILNREAVIAKAMAERRRHLRVQVDLGGRLFIPGDGRESECRIVDMSADGAQVVSEVIPQTGTFLVLYIEGVGRFEAAVVRSEWDRFGVSLRCSAARQERVAEVLQQIGDRSGTGAPTMRRHERIVGKGIAHFTRSTGETVVCEVIDLSLSGASLKTAFKPRLGETVVIGQMSGRVVRHHETGIAVEFAVVPLEKIQNPIQHFARRAS